MKIQTFSRFAITLLCALPVAAQAARGPIVSGGGKGIACIEGGEEKIYLADTFDLVRTGQIKGLEEADDTAVMAAVVSYLEEIHPEKIFPHPFRPGEKVSFAWMVAHANANLHVNYRHEIPELDDDNLDPAALPRGCRKVQLAVQDFTRNVVDLLDPLTVQLTHFEYGMLILHETLLNLRGEPGDTTPIRHSVAKVLEDPRLELRQLVRKLMEIRKKTNNDWIPENNPGQEFLNRNCWHDLAPQSELYAQCVAARQEDQAAWKKADAESAVPTLLRVPSLLSCTVTSELNNDLGWRPPTTFLIQRIKGNGRPRNKNVYELNFGQTLDLKTNENAGDQTSLRTQRHQRQYGFANFGSLRIDMSWITPSGVWLEIILTDYVEKTGELLGDIQLVEKNPENRAKDVYSAYGIFCHAPQMEFGIDLADNP